MIAIWLGAGCERAEQAVEATLTAQLQRVLAKRLGGTVRIGRTSFDQSSKYILATQVEFESADGELRGQADELLVALAPEQLDEVDSAAVELRGGEVWLGGALPKLNGIKLARVLESLPELRLRDIRLHWSSEAGSIDARAVVAELNADSARKRVLKAQLQAVSWVAGRVDARTKLQPHVLASSLHLSGEVGAAQPLRLVAEVAGLSLPRSAAHPLAVQEGRGRVVLAVASPASPASGTATAHAAAPGGEDAADGGLPQRDGGGDIGGQIQLDLAYVSLFSREEGQTVENAPPLLLADRLSLKGDFQLADDRFLFADDFAVTMPAPGRLAEIVLKDATAKVFGWVDAAGAGEVELSDIQVSADPLDVTVGTVALAWPPHGQPTQSGMSRVAGELAVTDVRLAELQPGLPLGWASQLALPEKAEGKLVLQGEATGSRAALGAPFQVRSELTLGETRVGPFRFTEGSLHCRHGVEAGRATSNVLERLELRSGASSLQLKPAAGGALALRARGLPLAGAMGIGRTVLSADGAVGATTNVRLKLERRGAEMQSAELWLGDGVAPSLGGCGAAAPAGGKLRLCGHGLAEQLVINLVVTPRPSAAPGLAGTLTLQGLQVGSIMPTAAEPTAAEPTDAELDGLFAVDGELELNSESQLNPRTWHGQLRLKQRVWSLGPLSFTVPESTALSMHEGRVQVERFPVAGGMGELLLSGFYDIPEADYHLQGEGALDADQLAKRSEHVRAARGEVAVKLNLRAGELPEVVFTPHVAVAHFTALGLPEIDLADVTGQLRWDGKGFRYDRLRARVGDGEITISGRSQQLAWDAEMELEIDAKGLALEPLRGMRVELDAQTKLAGGTRKNAVPTLAGKVNLRQLDYDRHIPFSKLMSLESNRKAADKPRMAFNLTVEDGGAWHVRNAMLDIDVASPNGIQVSGTDSKPGLAGELVAERGRVRLHGDELQLDLGRVRFSDRTDTQGIAAHFEVKASAAAKRRADARIELKIAGDSDNFDMTLRCDARGPVPPAYHCRYRGQEVACADLAELARLWACER